MIVRWTPWRGDHELSAMTLWIVYVWTSIWVDLGKKANLTDIWHAVRERKPRRITIEKDKEDTGTKERPAYVFMFVHICRWCNYCILCHSLTWWTYLITSQYASSSLLFFWSKLFSLCCREPICLIHLCKRPKMIMIRSNTWSIWTCAVGFTFTEFPGTKRSKGFTSTRPSRNRDRCWRDHLRVGSICGSYATNARKVETFATNGSTTWTSRDGATSAKTYGCTTTSNGTCPLRISGKTTSPHTTTFARPHGRWDPARNIRGGAKCRCWFVNDVLSNWFLCCCFF